MKHTHRIVITPEQSKEFNDFCAVNAGIGFTKKDIIEIFRDFFGFYIGNRMGYFEEIGAFTYIEGAYYFTCGYVSAHSLQQAWNESAKDIAEKLKARNEYLQKAAKWAIQHGFNIS